MSFKSKNINWAEVTSVGGSRMIPANGYVAVITAVEDVESKEYLRFTYDIAEGEFKDFFKTDDRVYTHQFIRSYKENSAGFMKQFLERIESSNDGFKLDGWSCEPSDLVGKLVGVIIQREDYTNKDGEDRARMNVEGFASATDIRNGRFKLPDPKDSREKREDAHPADGTSIYDADIPFV